jgi:hypothetical protein
MKLDVQTGEGLPLRHRLEVIDRLGGLDLDDADELASALRRQQPGLMETSNFLLYFAWSRRITRSCSSCSRTGRTRMGLNKTSDALTYQGVDAQPRKTRRVGGAGTGRNYGRGGQNITRLPHLTGFRPGSKMG